MADGNRVPAWQRRKSVETIAAELESSAPLHRVLGFTGLTSLGIGAIVGAGVFVTLGNAAANSAGPAMVFSYLIAAFGCLLAALCYAEFASVTPVAGSAYSYSYATLGEPMAWMIAWMLILELAISGSTVASAWTGYLNALIESLDALLRSGGLPLRLYPIPPEWCVDPWSAPPDRPSFANLPAALLTALLTVVLIRGVSISSVTNDILVAVKLGVVFLVIVVGAFYVTPSNWTAIPPATRPLKQLAGVEQLARAKVGDAPGAEVHARVVADAAAAEYRQEISGVPAAASSRAALTPEDSKLVDELLTEVRAKAVEQSNSDWGLLGLLGLGSLFAGWDNSYRSGFAPYGVSGIMLGSTTAFFAYIGFDSISTQIEEARRPQRDVPLAILASLGICALLYVLMTLIVTGMQPYYEISTTAPFAAAFQKRAEAGGGGWLQVVAALISFGALAAMTSVVLMSFLCQTRVFMVMARDGLLPKMFGDVHHDWRTPHYSTVIVGVGIALSAALTPITTLENLVVIGTLSVFIVVCGAVLVLRFQRPDLPRPFRCPLVYVVAPLGVVVNLAMLCFLPIDVWVQFVVWLAIGAAIYLLYGMHHSVAGLPPGVRRTPTRNERRRVARNG